MDVGFKGAWPVTDWAVSLVRSAGAITERCWDSEWGKIPTHRQLLIIRRYLQDLMFWCTIERSDGTMTRGVLIMRDAQDMERRKAPYQSPAEVVGINVP